MASKYVEIVLFRLWLVSKGATEINSCIKNKEQTTPTVATAIHGDHV